MPWEAALLRWVHEHASPTLDDVFVLSWELGTGTFCVPLVLLAIGWHLRRHERREALAWLGVGLAVAAIPFLLKKAIERPRPALWTWLLPVTDYSFPSGHAVAGAALYPLLGWLTLRGRRLGWVGYGLGLVVGVFIGVGRLYVGVHWPTDVLAGWAIGAALSVGAVRWLGRAQPKHPRPSVTR